MTRARLPLLVAALLLALVGCGQATPTSSAKPSTHPSTATTPTVAPEYQRYVALGDSYTAAPYVPKTDGAGGCIRSNGNYPHLIAATGLVAKLVDVSCGGAETKDFTASQVRFGRAFVPPQDNALNADTDLVTVGIGGNDGGLFGTIFALCASPASACDLTAAIPRLEAGLTQLGPKLVSTLKTVKAKAPHAKVLLIGYPKLAPTSGGCAQLPSMAPADLKTFNQANLSLNVAMANAARATGVTFVNVYTASKGHDVCSADPWVNGIKTDVEAAAALHPFAREQAAVAKLIEAKIKK